MAFTNTALAGRVAVITGGGSGIGFGIAQRMAEAGASVVLLGRNQDRLDDAVLRLRSEGANVAAHAADVRDAVAVQAAVDRTVETFGTLDIMVANAAGNFILPFADMSFNAWRSVIDIDLHGTFHCAQSAYPRLKASAFGGRFIAITTMRALEGWPGCAHAAAAKAGVMSLTRTLAVEWGPDGICCNTIAPGPIAGTEGVKRLYTEAGGDQAQLATVPLGRFGSSQDVAEAALYLCSDAGRFVTGTDLVVDGGRQRGR